VPDPVPTEPGVFLLSLDTELAWGYFDYPRHVRERIFSSDGSRERRAVRRLLDLFRDYDIQSSWAVVGHMFHASWAEGPSDHVMAWRGRYDSFDEIYGTSPPLWYGPDVVEAIIAAQPKHEIAVHGYTHRPLGEGDVGPQDVRRELEAWQRVAERWGIHGQAMTFPRNRVGNLHVLRELGIRSYRRRTRLPWIASVPVLGKVLNRLDMYLQLYPPRLQPIPDPIAECPVDLEASYWLFGMHRALEERLDALGLSLVRMHRVRAAVRRAALRGQVLHLWAHPWEFRTDADFAKLAYVLEEVRIQREAGRLLPMTMTALVEAVSARRHTESTG